MFNNGASGNAAASNSQQTFYEQASIGDNDFAISYSDDNDSPELTKPWSWKFLSRFTMPSSGGDWVRVGAGQIQSTSTPNLSSDSAWITFTSTSSNIVTATFGYRINSVTTDTGETHTHSILTEFPEYEIVSDGSSLHWYYRDASTSDERTLIYSEAAVFGVNPMDKIFDAEVNNISGTGNVSIGIHNFQIKGSRS